MKCRYFNLFQTIIVVLLNASFVSVLVRPLRTYARLHAGMRRATVQREAPQSVHVHADAARIRKGYKEANKYNCSYCKVR